MEYLNFTQKKNKMQYLINMAHKWSKEIEIQQQKTTFEEICFHFDDKNQAFKSQDSRR